MQPTAGQIVVERADREKVRAIYSSSRGGPFEVFHVPQLGHSLVIVETDATPPHPPRFVNVGLVTMVRPDSQAGTYIVRTNLLDNVRPGATFLVKPHPNVE
jgi:hypothetical protein